MLFRYRRFASPGRNSESEWRSSSGPLLIPMVIFAWLVLSLKPNLIDGGSCRMNKRIDLLS
jgi:hypothetical protein